MKTVHLLVPDCVSAVVKYVNRRKPELIKKMSFHDLDILTRPLRDMIDARESALVDIWKAWQEPTTDAEKKAAFDKHWHTIQEIAKRRGEQ